MNRHGPAALLRDQRGVAYLEMLIASPIILIAFLQIFHLGFVFAADLIVERAASAAARAAVVFLPDHPKYYPDPSVQARHRYIADAARLVLMASPHFDPAGLRIQVDGDVGGFSPLRVRVDTSFDCTPFLASFVCGLDRRFPLSAEATLPSQAN